MDKQLELAGGFAQPHGSVGLEVKPAKWPLRPVSLKDFKVFGQPQKGLSDEVNDWRADNRKNLARGYEIIVAAHALKLPVIFGQLWLRKIAADGTITSYGLASTRLVTNAGVAFIVDAFQNLVELENMKFHGIGTGTNAEAVGDTALQTELTTQYNPDNTRATGSLTETSANIFRTVATNTVDSAVSITEHMILSQAAVGGGTGLDRSVFTAVALASADSLQTTYDLTITAGG